MDGGQDGGCNVGGRHTRQVEVKPFHAGFRQAMEHGLASQGRYIAKVHDAQTQDRQLCCGEVGLAVVPD